MPQMTMHLNGDGVWSDLEEKIKADQVIHYQKPIETAMLDGGMRSGKPSIAFRFDLDDGTTVIAETSLELFLAVARAYNARAQQF